MANTEINDRKREEMKAIMAGLLARGWTRTTIAGFAGVSTSAVSQWVNGKSMGTNSQREYYAELPAFSEELAAQRRAIYVLALAHRERELAEERAALEAIAVDGIAVETDEDGRVTKTVVATGYREWFSAKGELSSTHGDIFFRDTKRIRELKTFIKQLGGAA